MDFLDCVLGVVVWVSDVCLFVGGVVGSFVVLFVVGYGGDGVVEYVVVEPEGGVVAGGVVFFVGGVLVGEGGACSLCFAGGVVEFF